MLVGPPKAGRWRGSRHKPTPASFPSTCRQRQTRWKTGTQSFRDYRQGALPPTPPGYVGRAAHRGHRLGQPVLFL